MSLLRPRLKRALKAMIRVTNRCSRNPADLRRAVPCPPIARNFKPRKTARMNRAPRLQPNLVATIGARMKMPWTGVSPRTGTETSPSKEWMSRAPPSLKK